MSATCPYNLNYSYHRHILRFCKTILQIIFAEKRFEKPFYGSVSVKRFCKSFLRRNGLQNRFTLNIVFSAIRKSLIFFSQASFPFKGGKNWLKTVMNRQKKFTGHRAMPFNVPTMKGVFRK